MSPDQIRQITLLEAEVKHLRGDLEEMATRLDKTNIRLDLLYDLLNQGRGMRWLAAGVFSLFGIGGLIALLQALQHFVKGN